VPWIFGDSGYGAYFPLLPIYIALRFFLAWFNAKHNVAAEEDDFMEEWRKLKRTLGEVLVTIQGYLGQHKVQAKPEGRKGR